MNYRYDDALRRGGDVAHLSTEASQFAHRGYLPYPKYCSGAFMSTTAFYRAINGHSAKFWGWGGEDDEFCARVAKYKARSYLHWSPYDRVSAVNAVPY